MSCDNPALIISIVMLTQPSSQNGKITTFNTWEGMPLLPLCPVLHLEQFIANSRNIMIKMLSYAVNKIEPDQSEVMLRLAWLNTGGTVYLNGLHNRLYIYNISFELVFSISRKKFQKLYHFKSINYLQCQ